MNKIEVLRTCYYVCLAFTVVFFVINVVLFFVFDIRAIFNIRTGRAKRKTVREMQAANDSTGRLRVGGKTLTAQLDKPSRSKKLDAGVRKATITPAQPYQSPGASIRETETDATSLLEQPSGATEVLTSGDPQVSTYDVGAGQTQQLSADSGQGSMMQKQYENNYGAVGNKDIHFVVTKRIIAIHTDERIA